MSNHRHTFITELGDIEMVLTAPSLSPSVAKKLPGLYLELGNVISQFLLDHDIKLLPPTKGRGL